MKPRFLLVLSPLVAALAGASVSATTTYYKDVLPILQTHCLSCHGVNPLAPIAFQTYRQARPWAEAIEYVVASRKMPPSWSDEQRWPPMEKHGALTAREISTIVAWVEQGAVAGDPHDAPPPFCFDPSQTAARLLVVEQKSGRNRGGGHRDNQGIECERPPTGRELWSRYN